MKRRIVISITVLVAMVVFLGVIPFHSGSSSAATQKTLVSQKYRTLYFGDYTKDTFTTTEDLVFMITVKITAKGSASKKIPNGGYTITLEDEYGRLLQNDEEDLTGLWQGQEYDSWYYCDDFFQPAGTYTYKITNTLGEGCSVQYKVIGYSQISQSATVMSSATVRGSHSVRIGKIGEGLPYADTKVSDESVLWAIHIEEDGTLYAHSRGKGVATATITLQNGRTYTTTVNVKPGDPNMFASLKKYNRSKNYFEVKIKNCAEKSVTIVRKNCKVVSVNKKKYNRKLKSASNVTIRPGETKRIKFYVRGSKTQAGNDNYTLYSFLIYEGQKYPWHVWDEDSAFKYDGGWWHTFWQNHEAYYESWL